MRNTLYQSVASLRSAAYCNEAGLDRPWDNPNQHNMRWRMKKFCYLFIPTSSCSPYIIVPRISQPDNIQDRKRAFCACVSCCLHLVGVVSGKGGKCGLGLDVFEWVNLHDESCALIQVIDFIQYIVLYIMGQVIAVPSCFRDRFDASHLCVGNARCYCDGKFRHFSKFLVSVWR